MATCPPHLNHLDFIRVSSNSTNFEVPYLWAQIFSCGSLSLRFFLNAKYHVSQSPTARRLCTDLMAFTYGWGKPGKTSARTSLKATPVITSNGVPCLQIKSGGSHRAFKGKKEGKEDGRSGSEQNTRIMNGYKFMRTQRLEMLFLLLHFIKKIILTAYAIYRPQSSTSWKSFKISIWATHSFIPWSDIPRRAKTY